MSSRRGLTLVEVLAAAALLAVTAAACVPILRSALAVFHDDPDAGFNLVDLGTLADRLREDPSAFGLTAELIATPNAAFEVAWPEQPERARVDAAVLACGDEEVKRAWLVLTARDRSGRAWSASRPVRTQVASEGEAP